VLAEAQATVAKVYAQAGVDVVWLLSGARFTIIILARESEMAVKMREVPNAMGYAPGSETVPGRRVCVLDHQINELARGFGAEKTEVLGTVIAHEVVHLLFLTWFSLSCWTHAFQVESVRFPERPERDTIVHSGARKIDPGQDGAT
jgi:hypothetical protein